MCTTHVYTNDPVLGGSGLLAATMAGMQERLRSRAPNERKMKTMIEIWEQ